MIRNALIRLQLELINIDVLDEMNASIAFDFYFQNDNSIISTEFTLFHLLFSPFCYFLFRFATIATNLPRITARQRNIPGGNGEANCKRNQCHWFFEDTRRVEPLVQKVHCFRLSNRYGQRYCSIPCTWFIAWPPHIPLSSQRSGKFISCLCANFLFCFLQFLQRYACCYWLVLVPVIRFLLSAPHLLSIRFFLSFSFFPFFILAGSLACSLARLTDLFLCVVFLLDFVTLFLCTIIIITPSTRFTLDTITG